MAGLRSAVVQWEQWAGGEENLSWTAETAEGTTAIAVYLAIHGFENDEIARALGVGSRAVLQHISDFQKGER